MEPRPAGAHSSRTATHPAPTSDLTCLEHSVLRDRAEAFLGGVRGESEGGEGGEMAVKASWE